MQTLVKELAKNNILIRIADFVKRPINIFHSVIASLKDPSQDPEVVFEIINKDKDLDRSDRLNMLELMQRYGRITTHCGPENLPTLVVCLKRHRHYLMKYLLDLKGIGQCKSIRNKKAILTNSLTEKQGADRMARPFWRTWRWIILTWNL